MTILSIYKGYTVDERLKQFRKLAYEDFPEFIDFKSIKGKRLLTEFRKEQGLALLPKETRAKLPPLYSQENNKNPYVICKFFYPDFDWTWYPIEFDGDDLFYGYVNGYDQELGYFTLSELLSSRGKLGLPIERDLYFKPCLLSKVKGK